MNWQSCIEQVVEKPRPNQTPTLASKVLSSFQKDLHSHTICKVKFPCAQNQSSLDYLKRV